MGTYELFHTTSLNILLVSPRPRTAEVTLETIPDLDRLPECCNYYTIIELLREPCAVDGDSVPHPQQHQLALLSLVLHHV